MQNNNWNSNSRMHHQQLSSNREMISPQQNQHQQANNIDLANYNYDYILKYASSNMTHPTNIRLNTNSNQAQMYLAAQSNQSYPMHSTSSSNNKNKISKEYSSDEENELTGVNVINGGIGGHTNNVVYAYNENMGDNQSEDTYDEKKDALTPNEYNEYDDDDDDTDESDMDRHLKNSMDMSSKVKLEAFDDQHRQKNLIINDRNNNQQINVQQINLKKQKENSALSKRENNGSLESLNAASNEANLKNNKNVQNGNSANGAKSDLICVVCGAQANGYNFDRITCESCKAFFRRNAFRPLTLFRCSNNSSCEITQITRKKCKKCRITKCFNLGMRKDWIMTEGEREEKRRKIQENRQRKKPGTNIDPFYNNNSNNNSDLDNNLNSVEMINNNSGNDCSFNNEQNLTDDNNKSNNNSISDSINNKNKPIRRRRRRRRHSQTEQTEKTSSVTLINHQQSVNSNNNNKIKPVPITTTKTTEELNSLTSMSSSFKLDKPSMSCLNINQKNMNNNSVSPLTLSSTQQLQQQQQQQQIPNCLQTDVLNLLKPNPYLSSSTTTISSVPSSTAPLTTFNSQYPMNMFSKSQFSSSNISANKNSLNNTDNNNEINMHPHPHLLSSSQNQQHLFNTNNNSEIMQSVNRITNSLTVNSDCRMNANNETTTIDDTGKIMRRRRRRRKIEIYPNSNATNNDRDLNNNSFDQQLVRKSLSAPLSPILHNHRAQFNGLENNAKTDGKLGKEHQNCEFEFNKIKSPTSNHFNVTSMNGCTYEDSTCFNNRTPNTTTDNINNKTSQLHKENQIHSATSATSNNNANLINKKNPNIDRLKNVTSPISGTSSCVLLSPAESLPPHNSISPLNSSMDSSNMSSTSSVTSVNINFNNTSDNKYVMTEIERQQVNAIKEAYAHAIQLVRSQGLPSSSKDINTTINITELGVRRIIFFFKLISDFRDLPHELMLKLLKQSMMNLLQIHGVNSFNRIDNTFKQPDTDDVPFTAESLKTTYGEEMYKITIGITNNLYDLCHENMTFIKILMLVVLFDPQNEWLDSNEKVLIEELQNKYVSLLYSYMCYNFGQSHAEVAFKGLIFELNKINDLSKLFERAVVENSNVDEVRPLMQEVFCLSNINTPPASASTNSHYSSSVSSVVSNAHSVSNNNNMNPYSVSQYSNYSSKISSNSSNPNE